jgi:hypothetical protein
MCIACASYQRKLLYFPQKQSVDEVEQEARGARLERWRDTTGQAVGLLRRSRRQPAEGRVLITYGNGSRAAWCAHYADSLQQEAAVDVFILEYPGYADRKGSPSERSLCEAADAALELLAANTNTPVYLLGESLGTGVASYLAGAHSGNVAGVVLMAPFNRLTDVAQYHMPLLPVRLLLADRFDSQERLRNFHGPVAVLVGGRDPVVPEMFGRRLYDSYNGPKRLWEFPDLDHGTIMDQPPEVWHAIFQFLRNTGPSGPR